MDLKFVVLGDHGVGKSSLLRTYVLNEFREVLQVTVGVDVMFKCIRLGEKVVRISLWDTAGEERFRSIVPTYMRNAHAIFFVYSITNILSFESLQRYWIPFANDFAPRDAVRVLIGSKSDQPELRAVPTILGKHFSRREGFEFFETSAKEAINIEAAVRTAAAEAIERLPLYAVAPDRSGKRRLDDGKNRVKLPGYRKCC